MASKRQRVPPSGPGGSSRGGASRPPRPAQQPRPARWNEEYTWLHQHEDDIRSELYDLTHPDSGFIIEYRVDRDSFAGYNVVETFDRYGWGGVCDFDSSQIYPEIVREWMRTLRRIDVPDHPEQMRLVGTVRGHEVEMTVPRVRELFRVDTGYELHDQAIEPTFYQCVDLRGANPGINMNDLREILIYPEARHLDRLIDLRPLPKALQRILTVNVNPRDSDARKVRVPDLYVLYALLTGSLFISYAYLAMCNIWAMFDTRHRVGMPHMALISRYVVHDLGNRIRLPQPTVFNRILRPTAVYFRLITFEHRGGVYTIRDNKTHEVYTSHVGGAQAHQEAAPVHGAHGYGAGPAQGWNMQTAWDAYMTRDEQRYQETVQWRRDIDQWREGVDTTLADLTDQLSQLSTTADNIYSVATRQLYHQEYYADAAYRASQSRADPMDIDHPPQYPQAPAPVLYRFGDPEHYPPPSAYQHYQPPPETEDTERFDGLVHSIFGYSPPYPRYPPPPPQ